MVGGWALYDAHRPIEGATACIEATAAARNRNPGENRAASVARSCAPLFLDPECRKAHEKFDLMPPSERAKTLALVCRNAYCPVLKPPLPALCDGLPDPEDRAAVAKAWSDFVPIVLAHDHGTKADDVIAALKSAPTPATSSP